MCIVSLTIQIQKLYSATCITLCGLFLLFCSKVPSLWDLDLVSLIQLVTTPLLWPACSFGSGYQTLFPRRVSCGPQGAAAADCCVTAVTVATLWLLLCPWRLLTFPSGVLLHLHPGQVSSRIGTHWRSFCCSNLSYRVCAPHLDAPFTPLLTCSKVFIIIIKKNSPSWFSAFCDQLSLQTSFCNFICHLEIPWIISWKLHLLSRLQQEQKKTVFPVLGLNRVPSTATTDSLRCHCLGIKLWK